MKKRFQNILNNKKKKNGIFLLLCAAFLAASLGTLAGCAIAKDGAAESGSKMEQMAGRWRIDFDKTDRDKAQELWGSGLSFGNGMEISKEGEFSYYIGITDGGTGNCEDKNGVATVEIQPFEEHSSEKEILTLEYGDGGGEEHIWMDWHGVDIYWKRESISTGGSNALEE